MAISVGRKAKVAVQFAFIGPQAAVGQLPNRFGKHRLDEARLDALRYGEFFREHGQHTKLTGNTARRKLARRAVRLPVTSDSFVRAIKSVYRREHLEQTGAAAYFWPLVTRCKLPYR